MTRDPDRVLAVLKVDIESSGAEESLAIKLDCVKAIESVSYASDPAKWTRFSNEVGRMVGKCEADMGNEMMRKRTVNGKPLLVISPEAESCIATMFEHSTCCYEGAVKDLYSAITEILKYWADGALDGSNGYAIQLKIQKPPKQLIQWRHPSPTDIPDSPDSPDLVPSEGDFDPRAVLHLKTNQILSLEPAKYECFREWLASSGVSGARELLEVLGVQQQLEQQRAELQRKIFDARRERASMFGFIGTLLFDLMHGGSSSPMK
jgi:hypothetical protein